jgi:hypothetical protein
MDNRVKSLKIGFNHLGRTEFAKIEKSLDLLDQCIEMALMKKKNSPGYVPIPDEEIDDMLDAIYKEHGIEVNEKPKLCIKCGFIHSPSSKCLDGSEPECN